MIVKWSFTKLNSLAWYTLGVANTNNEKTEIFVNKFRTNIDKDVLTRDNPPKSYTEEVDKT